MNVGAILIILLLVLSVLGIPVCYALGISTLAALVLGDMPRVVLAQKTFTGMDSVALLAIPFFMLAGNLMSGSVNKKLIAFCNALLGWVRGSLGVITVIASAIFAAISGSGVATVSAIGGTLIPAMKKDNYPGGFAAAVSSVASILGPIIPPSIFLIVYGNATETSIGSLFMAAVFPGIGLALLLIIYVLLYSRKHKFPAHEKSTPKQIVKISIDSVWALFMPILVLGGIFLGIFTATEAAAVTCLYALLVGLIVYRDLKPKNLIKIFADSGVTTATILILVGFSKVSSWVVVSSGLPTVVLNTFTSLTSSKIVVLLLVNILLLIVGMLMDANAAIVMLTPLLLPLITKLGVSTVQFGVIMSLNLCIGLVTPPVGTCILLGNTIAGEKLENTLVAAIPMILISLVWLLFVTYVPELTIWLPSVLGNS
ncbi:MAG: TRAP transporter large permease [Clostridia bacterium]|jgi:C4-dicarboxylate transporter DctM subunit|nr:TRAP transporter large permease [Clostridia bacterium]